MLHYRMTKQLKCTNGSSAVLYNFTTAEDCPREEAALLMLRTVQEIRVVGKIETVTSVIEPPSLRRMQPTVCTTGGSRCKRRAGIKMSARLQ